MRPLCTTRSWRVNLDRLVKSLLQKYVHLTGRDGHLTTHLANAFHEDCEDKAREFRACLGSDASDVTQQLPSSFSLRREYNRSALKRILQTIEVLGRLGLPLAAIVILGLCRFQAEAGSQIIYTERNIHALCRFQAARQRLVVRSSIQRGTYVLFVASRQHDRGW